jgi:hypothetical protein
MTMAIIKVFLSDEEKATIAEYAAMDGRSLSNLCRKALLEKIRRDRKKGPEGEIIRPPGITA